MTTWRAKQAQQTRRRILDTVLELLAEGQPAALSIPGVSRRSGISTATIYRHFRTKEELLDAAAYEGMTTPEEIVRRAPDLDDLAPFLHQVYGDFEKIEASVRAQLASRRGQEIAGRRMVRRQQAIVDTLIRAEIDPDRPEARKLARIIGVLASGPTYLDQLAEPRDEVIDALAWAVRVLTAAVRESESEPGAGGKS